ncbi:hypothetical protein CMV30_11140 [Nibricoccus aquaticus]|uniref:Uncharacterized protein n=1 Tax=Nibricoccus aquaticus TaxID=2576891 RepID=A0A290Q7J3_9BACT|nr:hypothetical protein [Nibricoccus aquaticus]ATC64464.1 hypothetical protein CMV30_11140 [Nibricoccus aquaticus]
MGCTIDHLRSDLEIRIIQEFKDVRGKRHRTGESGILRTLDLDWKAQQIVLTWDRDGRREEMAFALSAKDGPCNGKMRDYFDAGEYRPVPRPSAKEKAAVQWTQMPEPSAQVIRDPEQWGAAIARIGSLAARHRFQEANDQIAAVTRESGPTAWRYKQMADDLGGLAVSAAPFDREIYAWLRDRAIDFLHSWGSCATSGGEGAALAVEIDAWKRRFAQIDS